MTLVVILYFVTALCYGIYSFKKYYITPALIFVGMQTIMFSGILTYVDPAFSSDIKLVLIYLLALIMFISGTVLSMRIYPVKKHDIRFSNDKLTIYQQLVILGLVFVSIVACTYFFVSSGYNVFVQMLQAFAGGGTGDYTEERLALNNVWGVGYIYQFRVVIFPVVCAFLVTNKHHPLLRKIGYVCTPLMIIFILGTGQRGGFVMFILMFMVALLYVYKFYRQKRIRTIIVATAVGSLVLFGFMTIFNGRVATDSNVFQSILSRIFNENQECAVIGFRYIDSKNIQWGRDWFLSMMDILPGKNDYQQLSYVIFKIMYGTDRGTAPPCIWGSTYYNFGWAGIIFMPFIMGFLYHKFYYTFRSREINRLRIFLYSAMFVVLGSWLSDNPMVLFNQGFITLAILTSILRATKKKKSVYKPSVYIEDSVDTEDIKTSPVSQEDKERREELLSKIEIIYDEPFSGEYQEESEPSNEASEVVYEQE